MTLRKLGTHPSAWLLTVAGLMPLGAKADPAFSWTNIASPTRDITVVGTNGAADVLNGGRASVFFSDGSSDQALFIGSASGLDSFSVAETNSFVVVA